MQVCIGRRKGRRRSRPPRRLRLEAHDLAQRQALLVVPLLEEVPKQADVPSLQDASGGDLLEEVALGGDPALEQRATKTPWRGVLVREHLLERALHPEPILNDLTPHQSAVAGDDVHLNARRQPPLANHNTRESCKTGVSLNTLRWTSLIASLVFIASNCWEFSQSRLSSKMRSPFLSSSKKRQLRARR